MGLDGVIAPLWKLPDVTHTKSCLISFQSRDRSRNWPFIANGQTVRLGGKSSAVWGSSQRIQAATGALLRELIPKNKIITPCLISISRKQIRPTKQQGHCSPPFWINATSMLQFLLNSSKVCPIGDEVQTNSWLTSDEHKAGYQQYPPESREIFLKMYPT